MVHNSFNLHIGMCETLQLTYNTTCIFIMIYVRDAETFLYHPETFLLHELMSRVRLVYTCTWFIECLDILTSGA